MVDTCHFNATTCLCVGGKIEQKLQNSTKKFKKNLYIKNIPS